MPRSAPTIFALAALAGATGCPSPQNNTPLEYDVVELDEGADAAMGASFCGAMPGMAAAGAVVPRGFCVRRYASVGVPRTLSFAPNGDLFVAAPNAATAGGAGGGPGAVLVLSDDDHDGIAEVATFAGDVPEVHGLAVARGFVYFTTGATIFRTPYAPGQRAETPGAREVVAQFEAVPSARWTHGLAVSPAGAVYVTQGIYSASTCPDTPRAGTVARVEGNALVTVSAGYRNPMYMRCHFADETCVVDELGDDGGMSFGAREKFVLLQPGTQFGFPCCTTTSESTPFNRGRYDCAGVTRENATFPLNDTPFGLDFERGHWPLPFRGAVVVALHGSFYSSPPWAGARIVFAPTDPATHAPTEPWRDLVRGFDYRGGPLDRPSDVAFAPDGRLFFADDQGNAVYWLAPESLRMP